MPRKSIPRFPDECVGCGADPHGETWEISGRTTSWIGALAPWIGQKHIVLVPCCSDCRPRLRREKRIRDWSTMVAIIALCAVLIPRLDGIDRPLRKFAVLGAIFAALTPQMIFEVLHPPPFGLHVRRKTVDYEFASEDFADSFLELNKNQGAAIDE